MLCKVRKYELCAQKYANGCESCGRNLAQPDVKPTLSEVLAEVEKRTFWDYVPGRAIRIEDLKDVLSEYFA